MPTNLTPEQKTQYNTYRAAGLSPERALAIATKDSDNQFNPALEAGVDNILFGKKSLTDSVIRGVTEAVTGGAREIGQDIEKYGGGFAALKAPLSLAAGVGRGVGTIFAGGAETIDDLTGEVVSDWATPYVNEAVNSDVGQYMLQKASEWNEAGRGIPADILDATNLLGVTAIAKSGVAKTIKESIVKSADDIVETGVSSTRKGATKLSDFVKKPETRPSTISDLVPTPIKNTVEKARLELSDLDPQVQTALKDSTFDDVNRHFQYARNAVKDASKPTPLEIVGQKAEEAYKLNDTAIAKAVTAKKRILAEKGSETIKPETIAAIKESSLKQMGEKFGVDLTDLEDMKQIEGRFSKLDTQDQKLIKEYFTKLDSLGETPTLQEVDDFVDWAQSQLYKQSKSVSKLEVANDATVAELKQLTGKLNGALKDEVGGGYSQVNARIADLLDLQEEISMALGADARKGGGFVKRLFSPTGGNTKAIFERIKKETDIDLFKEAVLAKFAMENVGDVRQRSLLQSLDIAVKEANQVELTKPATILTYFREKADLDGQELANAFLRDINKKKD